MAATIPTAFTPEVAARLDRVLTPGALWVTDVDGTLWRDDIGEAFLQQLIAEGALVTPEARGIDVWAEYERRCAVNRTAGYAWATQLMAGLEESDILRRAKSFAPAFVVPRLLPEMASLLALGRERGVEIWIISASNHWVVKALAPVLEIPPERACGIQVTVENGRLTSSLVQPVPHMAGKVDAIRAHIGRVPALVTGDSSGDKAMMGIAAEAALLVVQPGRTDPALLQHAHESQWLVHELKPAASPQ